MRGLDRRGNLGTVLDNGGFGLRASTSAATGKAGGSAIAGAAICATGSWLDRRALLAASAARREAMKRPSTTA